MKPTPFESGSPDFDKTLPEGKEYFTIRYLAQMWGCSEKNIRRLIDEGSLIFAPDLAPKTSKHAMPRIHRDSVVAFLNDRNDRPKFEAMRAQRRGKK